MFTPKANSKQKCAKETQERETGDAVTCSFADSEILADSENIPDRFRH